MNGRELSLPAKEFMDRSSRNVRFWHQIGNPIVPTFVRYGVTPNALGHWGTRIGHFSWENRVEPLSHRGFPSIV
jgi:hypothetical protein